MASPYFGSLARPANTLIPVQNAAGCKRSDFHCEGLASCQSAAAVITRSRAAGSSASLKLGAAGGFGADGAGAFTGAAGAAGAGAGPAVLQLSPPRSVSR